MPRTRDVISLCRIATAAILGLLVVRDGAVLGSGRGEIVEDFTSTAFMNPDSTALWNTGDSGQLVAGVGIGGNGSDGEFVNFGDFTFNTDERPVFHFTSFTVLPGTTLRFRGRRPARINVIGLADIRGTIELRGGDGETAVMEGQVTAGGRRGPGGGRGGRGNPNGTSAMSPSGEPGQSAPAVVSVGVCAISGDAHDGGGCAGIRAFSGSGSGGGGGHRNVGGSDSAISPVSGLGGIAYGDLSISTLRGGSGGGGGGNDEDQRQPFQNDDPGGGGGGGGGAIEIIAGRVILSGAIDCDGGRGGAGFDRSGAGGGGSGGAIRIQAWRIAIPGGSLTCRGGLGGSISPPGRPGGGGSPGYIRFESRSGSATIDRAASLIDPPETQVNFPREVVGRSVARSLYYDTGCDSPLYAFDGSDPITGMLTPGPGSTDLVMPNGFPPGTSGRIVFFVAPEDPTRPGQPDTALEVGPLTNGRALPRRRFVRFEIAFDLGVVPPLPELPTIDRIRIRY